MRVETEITNEANSFLDSDSNIKDDLQTKSEDYLSKSEDYFTNSEKYTNNETNNKQTKENETQNTNRNKEEGGIAGEKINNVYSHSIDNRIFNKGQHVRRSHRYVFILY
jgi:hypothetical protein